MPTQTDQQIIISLLQHTAKIQRDFERKLSTHGIGTTEFLILKTLAESPDSMNQIALAEAVNLTPSGIARVINPMEKIHLVEKQKHPRDARMSMVAISDTGRQIYQDALVTFGDFAQMTCQNLDNKNQLALVNLLEKLR